MATTADASKAAGESGAAVYRGSCHCGFVTFTCKLDLSKPGPDSGEILSRCNCSICHKTGMLNARTDELKVVTPAEGDSKLTKYMFGTRKVSHLFCPTCGVRCFFRGSYALPDGTQVHFQSINVLTLEGREDGKPMDDLREIEVSYWDGKSNGWDKGLSKKPYEG